VAERVRWPIQFHSAGFGDREPVALIETWASQSYDLRKRDRLGAAYEGQRFTGTAAINTPIVQSHHTHCLRSAGAGLRTIPPQALWPSDKPGKKIA